MQTKFKAPRNIMLFLLLFFYSGLLMAQGGLEVYTAISYPVIPPHQVIDSKALETSTLIWFRDHLWTLNDSGNAPEIYRLNGESGEIIQTVKVENVKNNDWEELAQDESHIFIGDFGNNRGNRKDLAIYSVTKSSINEKKTSKVDADVINFSYANQMTFSAGHDHNFDCEAMISYGDSLLLFSKNRGNHKTTLYAIPKIPGYYTLQPLGSFKVDGLVTGASYNVKTKKLLLVGYTNEMLPFIFVFENFKGKFENLGEVYRFDFVKMKDAQTEGICWINDHEIYISAEKTDRFDQTIYHLDLKKVFELTSWNGNK